MSLIELELELETPLFAGGHEPQKLDELWILRPSEIKGVWRWWARALVAGALYDSGQLKGTGKRGVLKAPTLAEADRISKIVGIDMGLGYADPRGRLSKASNYSLIVEPVCVERFKRTYQGGLIAIRGERVSLQRATLLTLGKEADRKQIEYLAPGARFRLKIEEQSPANREAIEAALLSLSLALTFSGFGKGGRRGLGCFRVVRPPRGTYAIFFDTRITPVEKVRRAISMVRKLTNIKAIESEGGELPPLPSISTRKFAGNYVIKGRDLRSFQVVEIRGSSANRLLEELHNFFLRGVRARKLLGNPAAPDILRQRFIAWALGLPREQRGTGYKTLARDVDRRASPLLLAVHEIAREGVAYLSAFVSADWPAQLVWRGGTTRQITINERDVATALATAVEEFVDYAEKCGFKVNFIWP